MRSRPVLQVESEGGSQAAAQPRSIQHLLEAHRPTFVAASEPTTLVRRPSRLAMYQAGNPEVIPPTPATSRCGDPRRFERPMDSL